MRRGPAARVNECGHPERRHEGLGLCKACYMLEYRGRGDNRRAEQARLRERYARARAPKPDGRCRGLTPERALVAAEVLDGLGVLGQSDISTVCRKADYWIAA